MRDIDKYKFKKAIEKRVLNKLSRRLLPYLFKESWQGSDVIYLDDVIKEMQRLKHD